MNVSFKFSPFQHVKILPIEAHGRINRLIFDGGPFPIYSVDYFMNGESRNVEFYEDELE